MNLLGKRIRKMLMDSEIQLGMTEVAKVTGVSTSQIRYWERKGYIQSQQDSHNKSRHYTLLTLYKVLTIKYYLDQGYTLQVAVKKENEQRAVGKIFRRFLADRIEDIQQEDDYKGTIDLGPLDDDPRKEVYALVDQQSGTKIYIRNKK